MKVPVFTSPRKIQAFGSSLALTLPSLFVKANSIKKGHVGKVIYGFDGILIACCTDNHSNIKEKVLELIEQIENLDIEKQ
jgi:antitoxin component of MazEF toxin-antitoxin module